MIFNDRNIASFWHAKAVKFDTSYYTDFERQEIASRGLLRSYIEVPTIRKIVVSILVRAKTKYIIDAQIHDIADWLLSSGTSKLFSDRDQLRYYIARCTAVSVPSFSGLSATFQATFTCEDYRPYDAMTDQPIGDATTDLSNFTFDQKHCLNDMNCLFVLDNIIATPKVKRNAYEISGKSGTLRYDNCLAALEEKTMQGNLYFLKSSNSTALMTPQEISQRQHEVASWLINAKRANLVLDSDTTRYYEAEVIDQSELSFDKWANGMMKVKFILQPYCSDIEPAAASGEVAFTSAGWQNFSISDIAADIGYTTPLAILISNRGPHAVTDLSIGYYDENDVQKTMRLYDAGFSLPAGSSVTINSLLYDVLLDGTSQLKFVKAGDFPVVTPKGTKQIRIYANAATTLDVTVTMKRRWL